MKRIIQSLLILIISSFTTVRSQENDSIEVFLLTVDPGTEVYSIYGHSAIRILTPEINSDRVYNWGIFDFSTPNFAWKFSKGRLDYMIGVSSFSRFIEEYIYEERTVYSQKINLDQKSEKLLLAMIDENMLPENRFYRYDFFYDNCATRIRDLLEKSLGNKLIYPVDDLKGLPTFRDKLRKAQKPMPWLNTGINLLIGLPGDKKASFRDRMFLPADLMENLSSAIVSTAGDNQLLLSSPETVLGFEQKSVKRSFLISPVFVFFLLLLIMIILSLSPRMKRVLKAADIFLFAVFSILSILMIFFTFFTDHQAMKTNMNVIWINPFIILSFLAIVTGAEGRLWFRIVLISSTIMLISIPLIPQHIDSALIPLIILIIVRTSDYCGFKTNLLQILRKRKYNALG